MAGVDARLGTLIRDSSRPGWFLVPPVCREGLVGLCVLTLGYVPGTWRSPWIWELRSRARVWGLRSGAQV